MSSLEKLRIVKVIIKKFNQDLGPDSSLIYLGTTSLNSGGCSSSHSKRETDFSCEHIKSYRQGCAKSMAKLGPEHISWKSKFQISPE